MPPVSTGTRPPVASATWLAHVYAACLRGADWAQAHRRAVAAVGAPLVALVIVAINQAVLLDFPNSGDEYAYLYQARTLAAGRLWNAPAVVPEAFAFNYITQEPTRAFGSFPFGWPLVLALPLAAGLPPWLLNAALGVVTLGLVWTLGHRLYGPRPGVLAAFLVAVSPFFLFNAASYFSHTWCGALLLGAACLAARHDRTPWWVAACCGWLIGWAVLTRYFTGVVGGVAIVAWLLRPGVGRVRTGLLVALGGLPWVGLLMAHNAVLTGSAWTLTTTPLTLSRWFAAGFVMRGADIMATQVLRHLLWTPPALLVVYLVSLGGGPRQLRRGLLTWLPLVLAGALFFYVERGGNQYGPRFHYEVFPFLAIFAAAHLVREATFADKTRRDRWFFAAAVVSVALMPVALVGHAVIERRVIVERTDPFRLAAAAGLTNALVLIGGRVGTKRSMAAGDLTRNDLGTSAGVLYGLDRGQTANCALQTRMAGRPTYLYSWDRPASRGSLRQLRCP